jgi:hypothetical protein
MNRGLQLRLKGNSLNPNHLVYMGVKTSKADPTRRDRLELKNQLTYGVKKLDAKAAAEAVFVSPVYTENLQLETQESR